MNNADEIVRALKCCSRTDAQSNGCGDCPFEYCGLECNELCLHSADLIESQAREIKQLRSDLARVMAERDAAAEDLHMVCTSGEVCSVCKHCWYRGDKFPCSAGGEWCGGEKWKWRGAQQTGEGGEAE